MYATCCLSVCVWYAPLITSAVIGLFPLTLTEREMALRYEVPVSFRKSCLSKHAGFVPVPEMQQIKSASQTSSS